MPLPQTADEFIALVERSGLLPARRLADFVALQRSSGGAPSEAIPFAKSMIQGGLLTLFQAKQLLLGRHRGFDIGKYRLLEGLGSGGMSQVFLAQHRTMGHRVAIKLLPESLAKREPATIAQFFREARAAASLNHPNIVRAHDIDRHGDHYYMVMDYVAGATLHDLVMRRGPFAPDVAATCIAHAALGLQHIYEADLVHRDIKPGNLMLDKAGVVRIVDLGVALATCPQLSADETPGEDAGILGTADYLAPEQAMADANIDIRADIYSLGVSLYFLLSGKAPFEDLSLAQKLVGHQFRMPPAPPGPAELLAILNRMMAKRPEQRFQTPVEVLDALQPFLVDHLDPPTESEMPPLTKAAMGPTTQRTRNSATRVSATALLRTPPPIPLPGTSGPPLGASAGPRAGVLLAEPMLADDTPRPSDATTIIRAAERIKDEGPG
jgi:eukaryotic-like serine/threonine-protein kinase